MPVIRNKKILAYVAGLTRRESASVYFVRDKQLICLTFFEFFGKGFLCFLENNTNCFLFNKLFVTLEKYLIA